MHPELHRVIKDLLPDGSPEYSELVEALEKEIEILEECLDAVTG